jgi:hypothetical protein
MARKTVVRYQLSSAQSLATNFITLPTFVKFLDNLSYQIIVHTTNSIGTFSVQGSNNYDVDEPTGVVTNPGDWADLTLGGGVPYVNASNDDIMIDLNQIPFQAVRISYTSSTPGTGTCDIWVVARQIGG